MMVNLSNIILCLKFYKKTDKLFKPIDGYGVIQLMDAKNLKKFHKILTKDKFAPLTAELKFLSMDNILDI